MTPHGRVAARSPRTVLRGTVLRGTVLRGTVLRGTVLRGTVLLATVLLGTVCGDGEGRGPTTSDAPVAAELSLTELGVELDAPLDAHPVGTSLLVAERAGLVRELVPDGEGGYRDGGTVVDVRDEVGSTDSEKGLLGVTTDAAGGRMYLNHTRAEDGATVILELPLGGGPGALEAGEARELLVIDQPFANHNGGDLAWGPDDMLWIGTGDGGSADDPGGRAQRLDTLLGKVLRLDPSLPGAGADLAPADNPYAAGNGPAGADPLIWARGLRNPWRISFDTGLAADPGTGDLWIADVGQNRVEEVSVLRADDGLGRGADLGWDRLEGDEPFPGAGPTDGWPEDGARVVDPVHTYGHGPGCSVTGGFVYRGSALPELDGHYVFSDYCDGTLRALAPDGDQVDIGVSGEGVVSVNPDPDGEPLVLDATGVRRITPSGT